MSEELKTERLILGRVVSDKMDKTRTVMVERTVRHPLYGKFIRRSSKLHAHDEANVSREGDLVRVKECRPMSRSKRFMLVDVVESQTQG